MAYSIIQNQTGYVNPAIAALDTGWAISGIYAIHSGCNPGTIKSKLSLGLVVEDTFTITYTVDNYVSGGVYVKCGDTVGTLRTANGTYTETLVCSGEPILSFYSDGELRLSILKFADISTSFMPGTTVVFNEKANRWTSEYSPLPELMIKFIDSLFFMKNGSMWLQNSNSLANNFFGVQYPSKIVYYVNINSEEVKNFDSIRQQGSDIWGSNLFVLPYKGKPNGQQSRLKQGNYRNLQGDFFADILRDMTDPRFTDSLQALFKGASLQGKVLQVTIENNATVGVRLVAIDTITTPQNFTYSANQ